MSGDTWNDGGLECPYCGAVRTDDLQNVEQHAEDHECDECGRTFRGYLIVSHTYVSARKD